MKKFICLAVSALLVCALLTAGVFAEHTGISNTSDTEKIDVLRLLEIVKGDENGNLNLDAPVTRAEFVKMALCASTYKDTADETLSYSLFPDVTGSHWAAGYISSAIQAGWISGYLDGTFRPENRVTLEEAVVIALKMLGYTNEDFQGTYPESQLAKYEQTDLDTSINASRGDVLTRLECMKLIYNTLCTKNKAGVYYCTTLGYSADADNTVDYLTLLSNNMTGPFVNIDGSYKNVVSFSDDANIQVYRDGKLSDIGALADYDVYYYCDKLKTVWTYTDKDFGIISAVSPNRETPQTVSIGQTTYSLTPTAASKLTNAGGLATDDYVMILLDKDGAAADIVKADAAMYEKYSDDDKDLLTEVNKTISDPIVVKDLTSYKDEIPFDITGATILLDSEPITSADIRINDVLYYSEPFASVWVFRDTQSGVCSAISPNRENPASVTVSGKTYTLTTDDVIYKFSNYGTFKTDMLVTLLLGKDGNAVDVVAAGTEVIGDGEGKVPYAEVVQSTLKGPYIVESDGTLSSESGISLDTATVYKNNKQSSSSEIKTNNVYYYSKLLNTVWIYDDTVSGTVESISPTRVSPTSVTVSGKTYTLSGANAQYAFSSLGIYDVGDRVTLLLDKDGQAAGVTQIGEDGAVVYGVVIANGEKQYTDADGKTYTADYMQIFAMDGETYTYEYSSSYSAGQAVKVVVTDQKTQVYGLTGPKSNSYALPLTEAVKQGKFADNAQIIEYYNSSIYGTVLESRITGIDIWYGDILYYELNSDGEVEILILDDCTGDLVEYGLLTEVDGSYYEYILDGEKQSYSSGDSRFTVTTGPAYFAFNGTQITKIGNIRASVDISTIVGNTAYTSNDVQYRIDDNVRVYVLEDGEYKAYGIDKLKEKNYAVMTGYYDQDSAYGGKIRVIIAY